MRLDRSYMSAQIRAERARLNMTQEQLGDEVDVSAATISLWENGCMTPGIESVMRLSEVFGITPNDLLGWPGAA